MDVSVIVNNFKFLIVQGLIGIGPFVGGTLRLAVPAILLGFALGIFIGLARLANAPWIRVPATIYVEFFRGVPLYVLLLLGGIALGFFLPRGLETPGLVVRAIIVFTLFTAAYIAEIVRGGLQSLPRGQTEAAQALGLKPVKTTALIVLPQALRNVIPAIVGQFISLFKDTTLAGAAMGLLDVLGVADRAEQPVGDSDEPGAVGGERGFGGVGHELLLAGRIEDAGRAAAVTCHSMAFPCVRVVGPHTRNHGTEDHTCPRSPSSVAGWRG